MITRFPALLVLFLATFAALRSAPEPQPQIIKFSGHDWIVRPSGGGGPGPNHWDAANAWVDQNGWLHLRLSQRDGLWYCPEVYTTERLGFGRYQFTLAGPIDKLAPTVVFGLFNYPTPDVGRDGQDEIDIEFSQWGYPENKKTCGYTIWPARRGIHNASRSLPIDLGGNPISTHRFTWSPEGIDFASFRGTVPDPGQPEPIAAWSYHAPAPATDHVAQKSMPLHINLWLVGGKPPADGKPVEIVVRSFQFTPR